jgi:hypothetical protein
VTFNVIAFPSGDQPGVPHLDFAHLWPVIVLGKNAVLTFQDLVVTGLAPSDSGAVRQSGYGQAPFVNVFPSVIPGPGTEAS